MYNIDIALDFSVCFYVMSNKTKQKNDEEKKTKRNSKYYVYTTHRTLFTFSFVCQLARKLVCCA